LQVHGSGHLIRWLFDNQLVDEIILLTYPVVVGQGTRLFAATGPDTALDLVESRATPEGSRSRSTAPPDARSTRRPTEASFRHSTQIQLALQRD
jgi:dihydrofolate reductase